MTDIPLLSHRIGGHPASGGADWQPVTDSASGDVVARVPMGGADEVDRAVAAARAAWPAWREASLAKRSQVMFAARELLNARRDDLVGLVVREHGKVRGDAAGEVQRGLEVVEYVCGLPQLLKGEYNEQISGGVDTTSIRQPIGVAAGITPFNFPVMVPLWMLPVALACGNAFILKPSEKDPSASLLIADIFAEAGLPDGLLNVVLGGREAVDALLTHDGVDAVSFVGSTPVATSVHHTASRAGKRVQALGGAKNHAVVLPDADPDVTADALVGAAYGSAGERCMAISAVVAVGDVGDLVVGAIADRLKALRVGPGLDETSEMGPLITAEHCERVAGYVDTGALEGAALVHDGRGLSVAGHEGGHWLGPTLFDHVTTDMTIYRDEIFGPVLVVLRADDFDSALAIVNANRWANGTAVFTADGGAARRFQHEVEVGMVGINVPIPVPMAYHSFGGWKDSLYGDLHIHGPDGIRFYTRGKVVTSRWPGHRRAGVDLGFPTSS